MNQESKLISVIVPFYRGNRYMDELLENLEQVHTKIAAWGMSLEVLLVNDSPDTPVVYSYIPQMPVTVVNNEKNMGIHASRVNGIRHARGTWIQMLDQDDLLLPENYALQLPLLDSCEVVVGNCLYQQKESDVLLYASAKAMAYQICEKRFLKNRNMIASPGHCLIRREAIPTYWMEHPLQANGSDDYYLWMLMFQAGARFSIQEKPVYHHRNSQEGNLSFDLAKMHTSNLEMCRLLAAGDYPAAKCRQLHRSIVFKYLYDTKQLKLTQWLCYADRVVGNGIYKIKLRLKR